MLKAFWLPGKPTSSWWVQPGDETKVTINIAITCYNILSYVAEVGNIYIYPKKSKSYKMSYIYIAGSNNSPTIYIYIF